MSRIALLSLLLLLSLPLSAGAARFELVKTWNVPEANQGVGVDHDFFYAIDNRTIAKYDKETGNSWASGKAPRAARSSISTARW
jgi:hypothetical protein